MIIGEVYMYKKDGNQPFLAYITGGAYESGGRVSNFWHFKRVKADGRLSSRTMGDYNNRRGKFVVQSKARVEIKVYF